MEQVNKLVKEFIPILREIEYIFQKDIPYDRFREQVGHLRAMYFKIRIRYDYFTNSNEMLSNIEVV